MKLLLTSKDILNKQFKKNVKGYDAYEVDLFLDSIINDYKVIDNIVENLNNNISRLKKEIEILQKEKDEIISENEKKSKQSFKVNDFTRLDNINLLKKINLYESKLFELGVDPSKIK